MNQNENLKVYTDNTCVVNIFLNLKTINNLFSVDIFYIIQSLKFIFWGRGSK